MAFRPVVSNTSPLINLVGVGLLELLPQLYGTIWIPEAVREEYITGARASDPDLDRLEWLTVSSVSVDPNLLDTLDDGEAAAIALAVATNARAFLIDDRSGRRVARSLSLPVIGTLGVLLAAKQQALIPAIGPVIEQMRAQGRHISANLCAKVLRDANEATEV